MQLSGEPPLGRQEPGCRRPMIEEFDPALGRKPPRSLESISAPAGLFAFPICNALAAEAVNLMRSASLHSEIRLVRSRDL
jgi:hypothetical protein